MTKVDTLIIGTGVAGTAIAYKILDKHPKASILMLEAGPKVKMKDFALFQDYVITGNLPYSNSMDEPYPDRDTDTPGENSLDANVNLQLRGSRLMIYGGSTVHWGGWSFRLKPEDFKLKTYTGKGIDWPIDYDDLEPYYCESEHFIGVSGDSNNKYVQRSQPYPYDPFPYTLEDGEVIKALTKKNIDYNHMPIARHGITDSESVHAPCQTTGTCKYCPFGARFVAGNYLDDIIAYGDHPNLKVQYDAVVDTITMTSSNEARGVRYYDKNTKVWVEVEAKRVIIAAGSIESAKLLLRSKSVGHDNGIGNNHDLVGRNLITHPYFIYQANIPSNPERLQPEMNFPTLVSRYYDSPEEQKDGKFIIVSSPSSPLVNLGKGMTQGKTRKEMDAITTGKVGVQLHGIIEVFSEFDNRITPLDQISHLGMQETKVTFTKSDSFDKRMKYVEERLAEIFEEMNATDVKNIMISWRADHAACLTRMADSPEEGVVDKNLKVFGVDNLYVCSNASFSSLGAVNPTLTLGALSLRLGDYLVKDIENNN